MSNQKTTDNWQENHEDRPCCCGVCVFGHLGWRPHGREARAVVRGGEEGGVRLEQPLGGGGGQHDARAGPQQLLLLLVEGLQRGQVNPAQPRREGEGEVRGAVAGGQPQVARHVLVLAALALLQQHSE